jgi:formylglycine-generating enzyme required for sulfatase activity
MPDGAACGGETPFCHAGACLQVLPATRRVEPGRFGMGRAYFENGNLGEEGGPVILTRPFALAEAEVTQAEWEAVSGGGRPAFFAGCGGDCPVERVSWWSVLAFANALSAAHGLTPCFVIPTEHPRGGPCGGRWQDGTLDCGAAQAQTTAPDPYACTGWRLPTEAEWEYAARAGTTTPTYGGAMIPAPDTCEPSGTAFDELAWWCANAGGATHPVRGRRPNAWGLHDMLGNVAEWTWDVFTSHASGWGAVVTDPHASVVDQYLGRIVRGGHWGSWPRHVRSAARADERPWQRSPVLGFRLARTLEP